MSRPSRHQRQKPALVRPEAEGAGHISGPRLTVRASARLSGMVGGPTSAVNGRRGVDDDGRCCAPAGPVLRQNPVRQPSGRCVGQARPREPRPAPAAHHLRANRTPAEAPHGGRWPCAPSYRSAGRAGATARLRGARSGTWRRSTVGATSRSEDSTLRVTPQGSMAAVRCVASRDERIACMPSPGSRRTTRLASEDHGRQGGATPVEGCVVGERSDRRRAVQRCQRIRLSGRRETDGSLPRLACLRRHPCLPCRRLVRVDCEPLGGGACAGVTSPRRQGPKPSAVLPASRIRPRPRGSATWRSAS